MVFTDDAQGWCPNAFHACVVRAAAGCYTSRAAKKAVAAPKHNIGLQHFIPYGYYPHGLT
jgi:hypothetical protein